MSDVPPRSPSGARAPRCWTLSGDGGSVDVEVTASPQHRLADVLPVICRVLGGPVRGLWAGSERLPDDTPLTAPALDHGALLGLGGPVRREHPGRGSGALELHVVGGPDAGRALPLGQGRHVVGRSSDVSVRIPDPDLSRRHAEVHVAAGVVTVADLRSSNGSRLDGTDLGTGAREWPLGAVLRLGTTAMALAGPASPAAALEPGTDGRRRLRPAARLTLPAEEVEVPFPRPPAPPPRRRLAWVAVALPAVGGAAMAWVLHTPTFLFFALLSPVVALGTWGAERWSGRRSGRREAAAHAVEVRAAEERLADAVRSDVRSAEGMHPDLAALTTAARRRAALLWSRGRGDREALTVRIGSGPGPTRVIRVESHGARVPETAPHVPVVVDLRGTGGLAVIGPRERAVGCLSSVVAQLCSLHAPGEVDLLLVVAADRLPDWTWARWLPHVGPGAVHVRSADPGTTGDHDALHDHVAAMSAGRRATGAGTSRPGAAPGLPWVVVVVDCTLDAGTAATLRAARDVGIVALVVADDAEGLPVHTDAVLRISGETGDVGVLSREGAPDRTEVTLDRLPRRRAAELARDLAALLPVRRAGGLPRSVRLLDLVAAGPDLDDGRPAGAWSRARDRLVVPLGRSVQGPLVVDLCAQGPHALVAGTTGSGKSELLQTLVAALATNHPPDRCSFLLVDYKGGAAFAEAAALPHTAGLLTDLDGQSTARALRSLTAELTRREAILADHQVADIAFLPGTVDLARLVIVVDEFAGLSEELPDFVPGLVSIAQRGRSLGVHLVLATQRPGGVVSPEIRANCSLRICLRTTDEAESRDVLGTAAAAHLPLDVPGRAWLRSGNGTPTALQVARVAGPAPVRAGSAPTVRRWTWPYPGDPAQDAPGTSGESDLAQLCRALAEEAERGGVPRPHRPWRAPLPDHLPAGCLDVDAGGPAGGALLTLGLVDRPDLQAQEPLQLDLAEGGTWLVVGGPGSGRTSLLRAVLSEGVRRLGPDELHVHAVESGGGLLCREAAPLPHAGTLVGGDDALRTVRLVDRLAEEVTLRRASDRDVHRPSVLLLLDGLEAICTLLDEHDPGRGSASLLRLMRDGAAVGVTCVATADRAVPGGRLAAVAGRRLVLPLPDRADYAVAGIPARGVPSHRPPGRALVGEEAWECQLVLPRPPDPAAATGPSSVEPLRIVELPPDPRVHLPKPVLVGAPADLHLPVGPGGDEGRVLVVDLLRTGGLLVTGPPGSGRTTALTAFAQHLHALGAAVLRLGGRPSSAGPTEDIPGSARLDGADIHGVTEWLDLLEGPGVVIADDLGAPTECPSIAGLRTSADRPPVALLAAAHAGDLSAHYQGPVAALRRHRSGLLLSPAPGDADLFGLRLPRTPLPRRPGSGWLVTGTGLRRIQVARREPAAAGARTPQSRSSAAPISWLAYQASS